MLISDLLDLLPLFEHLFPEAFFTGLAQVFNLRPIAVTVFAVIVKDDENLKLFGEDVRLPYVFGAQLHLASADVVPILNKGGVEHDTADHDLLHRSLMVEDNLGVIPHHKGVPLLLCQTHVDAPVFLRGIKLIRLVAEDLRNVHALAIVHVEARLAATP